jgi:hypothetical protein
VNLVIPTSRFDKHLLPDLALVLKKFGPYRSHKLIVFATETATQEANAFVESLRSDFDAVAVEHITLGIEGWPVAPNRMFRVMAETVITKYNDAPWLLFEPDCTPIKDGWLQDFDLAYKKSGKPYFGCIVHTRVVKLNPDAGDPPPNEQHLVGGAAAIYPANAAARSTLLQSLDRQMPWSRLPLEPYDVRMRYEVIPYAAHNDLIAHRWGTINYKATTDGYTCENDPKNPPGTNHAFPVPSTAAVVHGCKDGSLARIILGTTEKMDRAPVKKVDPIGKFFSDEAKIIKHHDFTVGDFREVKKHDVFPEGLGETQTTVSAETFTPDRSRSTTIDSAETVTVEVAAAEPASAPKPEQSFTAFRVRKALGTEPGLTCKVLSERLSIDENSIKEFVRSKDSGFKLGPRGKILVA